MKSKLLSLISKMSTRSKSSCHQLSSLSHIITQTLRATRIHPTWCQRSKLALTSSSKTSSPDTRPSSPVEICWALILPWDKTLQTMSWRQFHLKPNPTHIFWTLSHFSLTKQSRSHTAMTSCPTALTISRDSALQESQYVRQTLIQPSALTLSKTERGRWVSVLKICQLNLIRWPEP